MAKIPTLADLKLKFVTEPRKRKRSLNPNFDDSKKSTKDNPKFIYNEVEDWTVEGRYLLIHLFFNIFKEKIGRVPVSKLPKVDEAALLKMKNPIAIKIIAYRKLNKKLTSFVNAVKFIKSDNYFIGDKSPKGKKAIIEFNLSTFGNVERIFTKAQKSIPLNMDVAGRKAFITPDRTLTAEQVGQENLEFFAD